MTIRAVIWDFGGVLSTSPFEAFARYEREHGLPDGFIRGINATNPDTNAWARFERNEIDLPEFCVAFEQEAAEAGGRLDGMEVIGLLAGDIRPEMIEAVRRCHRELRTALITNNVLDMAPQHGPSMLDHVEDIFHVVIESSKAGVRKPDPRIYEMCCDELGVAPEQCAFLDDLGVNLKPARAMGMATIKVVEPAEALRELESIVGFALT
jgi:putative hydrolase of the HAD superfamily